MRASPIAGRPGAPDEAEATNDLTDRPSIVLVNGLWPVWVDVVGYDPRWPDLYQRAAVQTPRRSSSVQGALGRLETLALPLRAASTHRWFGRRGCTPDGSRPQAIHLARRSDDTRSAVLHFSRVGGAVVLERRSVLARVLVDADSMRPMAPLRTDSRVRSACIAAGRTASVLAADVAPGTSGIPVTQGSNAHERLRSLDRLS